MTEGSKKAMESNQNEIPHVEDMTFNLTIEEMTENNFILQNVSMETDEENSMESNWNEIPHVEGMTESNLILQNVSMETDEENPMENIQNKMPSVKHMNSDSKIEPMRNNNSILPNVSMTENNLVLQNVSMETGEEKPVENIQNKLPCVKHMNSDSKFQPIKIKKKDLVGDSTKSFTILYKLAQANSLNSTGSINYNKYGKKDNIGFEQCTELFVDNFLLQNLFADYHFSKNGKEKKNILCGQVNSAIHSLLKLSEGWENIRVKAVRYTPVKIKLSSKQKEKYLVCRDKEKESDETKYFWQEYKIECANVPLDKVLSFIAAKEYHTRQLFLKDIDFTIDFQGSFDKDEVISHLLKTQEKFKMDGSIDEGGIKILDNDKFVGRNCLSYIHKVGKIICRGKIYNKMVQMLEKKGVRDQVGQHWKNWVCQKDTRLAHARDVSTNRGLTRAEVTLYCFDYIHMEDIIPPFENIKETVTALVSILPTKLVYSTPHFCTWKAHCENFLHTLVVVNRTQDEAVIVYSYNDVTNTISGIYITENWYEKENWCLSSLTLGKLAIDLIEVTEEVTKKENFLTIKKERKFRALKNLTRPTDDLLKLRIVSSHGVYFHNQNDQMENNELLKTAGLIPINDYFVPYLASSRASKDSNPNVEIKPYQEIEVELPRSKHAFKNGLSPREYARYCAKNIQEDQARIKQIEAQFKQRMAYVVKYRSIFSDYKNSIKLQNLPLQCSYNVMAFKEVTLKNDYDNFIFIINFDGHNDLRYCHANAFLQNSFNIILPKEERNKLKVPGESFGTSYDKPLAVLHIDSHYYTKQRSNIVKCEIELIQGNDCTSDQPGEKFRQMRDQVAGQAPQNNLLSIANENTQNNSRQLPPPPLVNGHEIHAGQSSPNNLPSIANENTQNNSQPLPPPPIINGYEIHAQFRQHDSLVRLPIGSIHTIKGKAHRQKYGREWLLVKLDDNNIYLAGDDLESKEDQLTENCKIKIIKKRTLKSCSNRRVAICKIAKPSDWSSLVEYQEAKLIPASNRNREAIRILDTKLCTVNGIKRKLLLAEDGEVYRMKRCKLEDEIQANDTI